jgi:predicted Zn-dependent protease
VALGLAYARLGDPDSAVTTLGRTARRYPNHRDTYVALGRIWLDAAESRQDRVALGKALSAFRDAARAEEDSEVLTLLGRALLAAADAREAEAVLHRASERRPVDPLAFYYLADASERRGHARTARQALLDYLALVDDDEEDSRRRARIAVRIGDLSLRVGEPGVAVEWYGRAAAAGSADEALLLRTAEAQMKAGRHAAARATLDRVLKGNPANAAALALREQLE